MPRLEQWSIGTTRDDKYTAPELMVYVAHGKVYDSDAWPKGHKIRTSYIEEINIPARYIQTRNTRYELGKPLKKYLTYLKKNKPEWYAELTKE